MTTFKNSNIAAMDLDQVSQHVASTQTNLAKTANTYRRRERTDHSKLMLEARTMIKTIEQSVSLDKQAEILTRHQIRAATPGVSSYTPWIKLLFGKHNEKGKLVKFGGQEHVKWEPDESYGRYMNFYEVIDRDFKGAEDKLLDWVVEKGGPATIVKAELDRKKVGKAPSAETIQARRHLYLEETDMPPIHVPEGVISSAEEFVGVVLQKTADGFRIVGMSKADAQADFDRMAEKQFDALTKAKTEREAAEEAQRKLDEAKERGAREAAEQMAASMGLTVEQMRAKMADIAASVAAAAKSSTDQQAAD